MRHASPGSIRLMALLALTLAGPAAGAAPLDRDRLLERHDSHGERRPVARGADWESRRQEVLGAMQGIMGPYPGTAGRCPLDQRLEQEEDRGDYLRWTVSYQIRPSVRVAAYLLIPKTSMLRGRGHRAPAVLALHQTHKAGRKVVVGLGESPDDEYGVELVQRGYVVLAPPYPMLADYWPDVKGLGFESGTMLAIWINSRGLDLLEKLPFVRKDRGFGAIGHSLGGHNGIFTAAFDARIRVVVSSCGLDSFRDYYGGDPANWAPERGWCQTRYMPRLADFRGRLAELPFDFPEILGAIAPRRVFISAPLGDTNFRAASVDRVADAARPVFALLGKPEALTVVHPEGPHRFPPATRTEAYRVIDEVLRP